MKKFNKKQIADFQDYEQVRSEGNYNMYSRNAELASGLSHKDYLFVMKNYTALHEQANAEEQGAMA